VDNCGYKIEVTKVSVEKKEDVFLYLKNERKQLKENSIDEKLT